MTDEKKQAESVKPEKQPIPNCVPQGRAFQLDKLRALYKKTNLTEEYVTYYFTVRKEQNRARFFHFLFKGFPFTLACQSAGLSPQAVIDELAESVKKLSTTNTKEIVTRRAIPLDADLHIIFAICYSMIVGDLHARYRQKIEEEKGNGWQKWVWLISSLPSITDMAGLKESTLNLGDPGSVTLEELAKQESNLSGIYQVKKIS